MPGKTSSAKALPTPKTLEVPKVLNVRIADGILGTTDARGTLGELLFRHLHSSLNDKNDKAALEALAKAHGYEVKEDE